MATTTNTETKAIHPVVKTLLEKRGYGEDRLDEFFSWDLRQLPDLTNMKDMEKTALRIIEAIDSGEKIGIYGDYDVDGTTSCALFHQYFQMLDVEVELFQPSRFVEGYGIHPSSVDNALEKGVKLLISVDCGISNLETAEYAKEKDLDLIVTDHHKDTKEHIPRAYAVVNPNRRDEPENSPLKALAGVGVAFAVCLKVKNLLAKKGVETPSIYPLLQFVGIGTICDMAPLNPMNMKLTRHGLKQIPSTQFAGIECFFSDEDRQAQVIPSEKISFYVGPLINSKGRLDHPEKALNLLISKEHKEAFQYYSHLEISNRERKLIQAQVFEEAKKQVISEMRGTEHLISVVYSPEWHEGVIGIVASKLVETFGVPAVVFTDSEDKNVIKASARSAGDLDLFQNLKECEELFLKFGGHKAAAGLSMPKDNFTDFKNKINMLLSQIPPIARTKQDMFDAQISFNDIDRQLLKQLDMLEPFGMGNAKPLFRMEDARLDSYTILKDVHVKWVFTHKDNPRVKLGGISFNFVGKWGAQSPEEIFQAQSQGLTIYFSLGINRFRGNEIIQLMVEKIYTP